LAVCCQESALVANSARLLVSVITSTFLK